MLTYGALLEQAETRGMPITKLRGILREYLQILILKELSKAEAGGKLYFTGGTYLRLAHNLKRFSEDLDFNASGIAVKEFEGLAEKLRKELKRQGINCHCRFKHWGNIYAADLAFPDIEKAYNITSKFSGQGGIIIKIETNRPKWKIKKEPQVISGFGELYPCLCTDVATLFADKIDALNKKERARHLYDIIFLLANSYPLDKKALSALGIKSDPLEIIAQRVMGFSNADLKKQAESLRPFLFEEADAALISNARQIVSSLLKKYRRQNA
jgi:hypothetical protein